MSQNKVQDLADRCSRDPKDGYRSYDKKDKPYCTLLDPNYNSDVQCKHKGLPILMEVNTTAGKYHVQRYYCGKPKKD